MQKIILCSNLCPGDVLTLTAAVESLALTYPGEYSIDVRTTAMELWENNPRLTPIPDGDPDARRIDCHYPAISRSNQEAIPFLAGYTEHLGEQLGRPLRLRVNRPYVYLSEKERAWTNQVATLVGKPVPYAVVAAGVKRDFTAKSWPLEHYQAVIELTRGAIQWVQIGAAEHEHPPLAGVIDLRGKTDHRQLCRLVYHSLGGLGPVTYLQHLCAALERPYLCLLGGREPATWVQYPLQHTLSSLGALSCCRRTACWKSRVVPLGDGDEKDASLCDRPVVGLRRPSPQCLTMIRPETVAETARRVLGNG